MTNENILREHIDAFCKGDWGKYKAHFTDGAIYEEEATRRVAKGPDQIVQSFQSWRTAFPDVKGTVKSTVATGDAVVAEIEWTGTHNGPLALPTGSIPPTGRVGSVSAVQVARFENGKIRELHHYFDLMTILAQMGVVPQGVAPAAP